MNLRFDLMYRNIGTAIATRSFIFSYILKLLAAVKNRILTKRTNIRRFNFLTRITFDLLVFLYLKREDLLLKFFLGDLQGTIIRRHLRRMDFPNNFVLIKLKFICRILEEKPFLHLTTIRVKSLV